LALLSLDTGVILSNAKRSNRIFIIVATAVVILFVFLLLRVLVPRLKSGNSPYGDSLDENFYSISAVGFAGFQELMSQAGGPKIKRQTFSNQNLDQDGLLLVSGNDIFTLIPMAFEESQDQDPSDHKPVKKAAALVFLSKWDYGEHPDQSSWVAEQKLKSSHIVEMEAEYLLPEDQQPQFAIVNWPSADKFSSIWDLPAPVGRDVIQLLKPDRDIVMEPIVYTPDGILVARFENLNLVIYLVTDPDVANNHGLGLGNNADFILKVVKNIYRQEGLTGDMSILDFDVTDFLTADNQNPFFGPLLEYPYFVITLLTILTALIFFAAVGQRFGGLGHFSHEVGFGKTKLIDNSAKLMARPNLLPYALEAYQKMTIQWAEKTFHAPSQSEIDSLLWLDKVAAAKGLETNLTSIVAMGQRARNLKSNEAMISCALKLYKFRKELESGSSHPGRSGQ
jgi:hypothetical protein